MAKKIVIYLLWGVTSIFYFYQYILRVVPNVFTQEIHNSFAINAEQFSTLGSLYLLAYALLQVPLGMLVDKYGVCKIVIVSVIVCIIGSVISARTHSFAQLQLARILIGTGSASAFMSALKVAANYMPKGSQGFMMGCTLAFGTIGALSAGHVLVWLTNVISWRGALLIMAACGAIILLLLVIFIGTEQRLMYITGGKSASSILDDRTKHHKRNKKRKKLKFRDEHGLRDGQYKISQQSRSYVKLLIATLKNKYILLYATLTIGLYAPLAVLADLWGASFLSIKFGISSADAARASLMLYLGLCVGSLLLPWICEKFNVLDYAIATCSVVIAILLIILIYGDFNFNDSYIKIMMISIGFFAGAEMMCFTAALQRVDARDAGVVVGCVNTLNMLGTGGLQQIVGWMLDREWTWRHKRINVTKIINCEVNDVTSTTRDYCIEDFAVAMSSLVMVTIVCCIISFVLVKKKKAMPQR